MQSYIQLLSINEVVVQIIVQSRVERQVRSIVSDYKLLPVLPLPPLVLFSKHMDRCSLINRQQALDSIYLNNFLIASH